MNATTESESQKEITRWDTSERQKATTRWLAEVKEARESLDEVRRSSLLGNQTALLLDDARVRYYRLLGKPALRNAAESKSQKKISRWLIDVRVARDSLDEARKASLSLDDPAVLDRAWERFFRHVRTQGPPFSC